MSTTDFTHHESTAVARRPSRLKEYANNAMLCYFGIWFAVAMTMVVTTLAGKGTLPSPNWFISLAAHVDAVIISLLYAAIIRFVPRRRLLAYYGLFFALEVLPWLVWGWWGPGPHPVGVYVLIVFVVTPIPFTASFWIVCWLFDRLTRRGQASVTAAT